MTHLHVTAPCSAMGQNARGTAQCSEGHGDFPAACDEARCVAMLETRLELMTNIATTLVDCFDAAMCRVTPDMAQAAKVSNSARAAIAASGLTR